MLYFSTFFDSLTRFSWNFAQISCSSYDFPLKQYLREVVVQNFYIRTSDKIFPILEPVAQRFSVKKVFLKISQNSQEKTSVPEYLF